ncbi:MAG TPA: hypothetical protein VGB88_07565 [Alphaproteobacteria bacterium]
MHRPAIVLACVLCAAQAQAQEALTPEQAKCILDYIDAAKTAQGARDIRTACVDYRGKDPELFSCVIKQQVKAHSDAGADAIREACQAMKTQ